MLLGLGRFERTLAGSDARVRGRAGASSYARWQHRVTDGSAPSAAINFWLPISLIRAQTGRDRRPAWCVMAQPGRVASLRVRRRR
jgi:hypothetical protein